MRDEDNIGKWVSAGAVRARVISGWVRAETQEENTRMTCIKAAFNRAGECLW